MVYLEPAQLEALRAEAKDRRISLAEDAFAFDAHFLVYRYGPQRRRSFHRLPS